VPQLVSYYGPNGDGANMPFNFQLISAPWNATEIARIVSEYDHALPLNAWPNWVLGNHDNRRVASRIGARQARVAAMLLLTVRGTPTLYYGDEIAIADGVIPPDRVQDPAELRQPGIAQGRDPERTPMQWDGSPNAGFSSGVRWLPISGGDGINVVDQDDKTSSMLTFYRRLLALRRSELALVEGAIERVVSSGSVLTYERRLGGDRFFIALNMAGSEAPVEAPEGTLVLSTTEGHEGERIEGLSLLLAGDEGIVIRASEPA
jgi:alpha-glucosidase